ncbi:MAG: iron transporter [Acidobacteria bacterium]|nr:iron transporter [Acidobacteriota bacterium]
MLLAATGVGAGDLLTSTLAGSEAGLAVLWCVAVGAILKWTLTEGIARWQLATGMTILEGWSWRLGGWIRWVFLCYLLLFTAVVGRALTSACGVAGTGFYQIGDDPQTSVLIWAVIHSLVGLAMVLLGSFALFEKVMSALIGIMFVTVLLTAVVISPDWGAVALGFIPSMPANGSEWVLAVLGGVGGTVTLLSYGYWIQEQGRKGKGMLPICRIDLAVGNGVTGLFGVAVIIIGSRLELQGQGSMLALAMADQLAAAIGPAGRWIFLLGFWGAVFSSLLGVWQSIPYLFADFVDLQKGQSGQRGKTDLRTQAPYKIYVCVLAIVPLFFLETPVKQIQLIYGVFGALFLPLLALTLLIMNNRKSWVGEGYRTPWVLNAILLGALLLFTFLGLNELLAG